MFESLGLENLSPMQASVYLGLALGLAFGALAQFSRFCLRRALAGDAADRRPALAVWLTGLAAALFGTQALVAAGLLDFGDHRYLTTQLPLVALISGGLLFGIGMVLTRGCISRLTVLSAGGNLRALSVVVVFAVVAHATLKGVLSPIRTWLAANTVDISAYGGHLASSTTTLALVLAAIALLVFLSLRNSGARPAHVIAGALIGLLVPLAWFGNGVLLYDDFDPLPLESLSFTLPHSQTAFWVMASTAVEAGFGTGLIGGVLLGSLVLHLVRGEWQWQSFQSPAETGRYFSGAVLMGVGGVLAGGCTVGAGLAGVSTLGISAVVAIVSIAVGAKLAARFVANQTAERDGNAVSGRTDATADIGEQAFENRLGSKTHAVASV